MMSDIRKTVLTVILGAMEPIKSAEIRAHHLLEGEDPQRISNQLFQAKQAQLAVADESGRYSITAKGRAALGEAGLVESDAQTSNILTSNVKREDRKVPIVQRVLEASVAAAQCAIDDYVSAVGDPAILGPLQRARDEARAALQAYQRSESRA